VYPKVRSLEFRPFSLFVFWLFLFDCFLLGWIGAKPIAYPFLQLGQLFTFFYFFCILEIMPFSHL